MSSSHFLMKYHRIIFLLLFSFFPILCFKSNCLFLAWFLLKTKQTKVTPLRGGNLSNGHRGSIQNSPVYELRHVICKNGSSLSQSTHWVTRSEQGHFDKFCFHDDELTSEKGEVSKDLYSVEYSQMLACFHF